MNSTKSIFAMIFLWLITSCSEPQEEIAPDYLLDKSKFATVLVDVQLIEGMKIHKLGPKRERSPDMEAMYANIFTIHQISQEDFEATYDYYKDRPKEMELIYEQVLDSLSKIDAEVKKIYNTKKSKSDTLDIDSITNASAKRKFQPLQ